MSLLVYLKKRETKHSKTRGFISNVLEDSFNKGNYIQKDFQLNIQVSSTIAVDISSDGSFIASSHVRFFSPYVSLILLVWYIYRVIIRLKYLDFLMVNKLEILMVILGLLGQLNSILVMIILLLVVV